MKITKISILSILFLLVFANFSAQAQGDSIALAPARVELEMKPGTEATVVINLDYRSSDGAGKPARIVANLNDWDITRDGRVEFYKPNTKTNSASSWLVYSPAETTVTPGNIHSIRVTVSVPADAAPGDHLTALIVEQRPDTIKFNQNARQMVVRYRMASVFYIKVPNLTKRGTLENLQATVEPKGIVITPTLKNAGNSVIRPTASVKIMDSTGKTVAELPEIEPLPVLVALVRHLLACRQYRLDPTEVHERHPPVGLLHNPGHDVAHALAVLLQELLVVHLVQALVERLAHDLGRDAREVRRGDVLLVLHHPQVAGIRIQDDACLLVRPLAAQVRGEK